MAVALPELHKNVIARLLATTRSAGQLAAADLPYQRTLDRSLASKVDRQNARLLELAQRLLQSASGETGVSPPKINDVESLDDNWNEVVDVVDNLLEKTDAALDEFTGTIKKIGSTDTTRNGQSAQAAASPANQDENTQDSTPTTRKSLPERAARPVNLAKPQTMFFDQPDNHSTEPFKPLLKSKPHAITPLSDSQQLVEVDGEKTYKHPYESEIQAYTYPPFVYEASEPIPYHPIETTTAIFVDTIEGVEAMLTELKRAKEIAIDLEHHDMHSYVGLVSLMQISTRDQDWIVDTLKPWRRELQILNKVFADPSILKVFHGSHMDIIWLQRDLGLYIVGLFDTYHASNALAYPKHSLAYLLERFAGFQAQKQYQMADWRLRPLTKEMFDYARSDTHFLLYIYDMMRNELIMHSDMSQPETNLLLNVQQESNKECLQRYERSIYDPTMGTGVAGWYHMLIRTPALFSKVQFSVFKAVHAWRDKIARDEDEGPASIMTKNVLLNLAREMPTSMTALMGCLHPMSKEVRARASDLVTVIRNAKNIDESVGPEMSDFLEAHPLTAKFRADRAAYKATQMKQQAHLIQSTNQTLAEIIEQERQKVADLGDAIAPTSNFWGPALLDGDDVAASGPGTPRLVETGVATPETSSVTASTPMRLLGFSLPMPPLSAEVFTNGANNSTAPIAYPRQQPVYQKERAPLPKDDVFIVKELGSRKRKVDDSNEDLKTEQQLQDVSMDNSEEDAVKVLSSAKAPKAKVKDEQVNEEEYFDYASAPSVLNASSNTASPNVKKSLDPYKKSLNAPKGLGRARKEGPGKSGVFN